MTTKDFSHLIVGAGDWVLHQLRNLPGFNIDNYLYVDLVEEMLGDERISDVALNVTGFIEEIGKGSWLALCARHKRPDVGSPDRVSLSVIAGGVSVGVDVKTSSAGSPRDHLRSVA